MRDSNKRTKTFWTGPLSIILTALFLTSCSSTDKIDVEVVEEKPVLPSELYNRPNCPPVPTPPVTNEDMLNYRRALERCLCQYDAAFVGLVHYSSDGTIDLNYICIQER